MKWFFPFVVSAALFCEEPKLGLDPLTSQLFHDL